MKLDEKETPLPARSVADPCRIYVVDAANWAEGVTVMVRPSAEKPTATVTVTPVFDG